MPSDGKPWRRRAAARGWLAAGLALLAVALLGGALLLAHVGPNGSVFAPQLPVPVRLARAFVLLTPAALAASAATMAGLAAVQAATAMRVLSPDRPAPEPLSRAQRGIRQRLLGPLADRLPALETPTAWPASNVRSAVTDRGLRLTILIPAHNEEAILPTTLAGLTEQTRAPDRVILVADNCTDRTVAIGREHGLDVIETVGNTEKKAGALNQVLALLLPDTDDSDLVMVMDADTTISPHFLETAVGWLTESPDLVAVGGLFYGEQGGGLLGQFQRNEFHRYQRRVQRRADNRVYVLTGTATVFRAYALQAVADARGELVPGRTRSVYDTAALTEDNELTLALKSLGGRLRSPPECIVTTEIMTTWRSLWRQRQRWFRGALENIGDYGLTRATALYWRQQLGLLYGVVALAAYLVLLAITLLAADSWVFSAFWIVVGLVFVLERVVTVWGVGARARWLAVLMLPELGYALFLQACFVFAVVQILVRRRADWNYVDRETPT